MNATTESMTSTMAPAAAPNAIDTETAKAMARVQKARRIVIPASALPDNAEMVSNLVTDCDTAGIPLHYAYDMEAGIPDGFNLAIVPLPKNQGADQPRLNVGMVIGIVPSFDATVGADGGSEFVAELVSRTHVAKLANVARPLIKDASSDVAFPTSVADYLVNQRSAESLDGFNAVAMKIVAQLKALNMPEMNKSKLRKILEVSAYAETEYANIPQTQWDGVIDLLCQLATAAGKPVGVMASWKESRYSTAQSEKTFDLGALTAALADGNEGDDEEEHDAAE